MSPKKIVEVSRPTLVDRMKLLLRGYTDRFVEKELRRARLAEAAPRND